MADSMQSVFEIMLEGAKTRIQRRNSPELFQMLAAEVTGSEMANTREAMAEIAKATTVYNAILDAATKGTSTLSKEQVAQAKADYDFVVSVWSYFVKPRATTP